jgi:hypothetical protein
LRELAVNRLLVCALGVTLFFGAVTSLWWFPTGREVRPVEAALRRAGELPEGDFRRGFPVVALRRYADLQIELDGKPVPVTGPAAARRRRFSESLRSKPRPVVDPVVVAGVGASSVDITRVEPEDGPRPGQWSREEHWIRAAWTDEGVAHERAWNASEIMRAFEREVGRGQEPEAVFLEMVPPVQAGNPRLFAIAATWLLCAWIALVTGLCEGKSPRTLFGRTLLAVVLGPVWILLAWLFSLGPRLIVRRWRAG